MSEFFTEWISWGMARGVELVTDMLPLALIPLGLVIAAAVWRNLFGKG